MKPEKYTRNSNDADSSIAHFSAQKALLRAQCFTGRGTFQHPLQPGNHTISCLLLIRPRSRPRLSRRRRVHLLRRLRTPRPFTRSRPRRIRLRTPNIALNLLILLTHRNTSNPSDAISPPQRNFPPKNPSLLPSETAPPQNPSLLSQHHSVPILTLEHPPTNSPAISSSGPHDFDD